MEVQPKDTSKGHFYVSLVKSFLRITAGTCFILGGSDATILAHAVFLGGVFLIAAEILGIVEELV
jgi:hypothetical protein